ncbi:MAG: hypothetical protein QM581_07595 [Pseudomonas sp.]
MGISSITSPTIPGAYYGSRPATAGTAQAASSTKDAATDARDSSKVDTDTGKQRDGGSVVSSIGSFASGALGLDDPTVTVPEDERNASYSAGRGLAAIGTVGALISLLA